VVAGSVEQSERIDSAGYSFWSLPTPHTHVWGLAASLSIPSKQYRSFPQSRRSIAIVLLCAQVFTCIGIPFSAQKVQGADQESGRPYPCMDRACGCATYSQCWAGACCCYTMREKLAWARAKGISPPAAAIALAEQEVEPKPSASCTEACQDAPASGGTCCHLAQSKPSQSEANLAPGQGEPEPVAPEKQREIKWVLGVSALQCHGLSSDVLRTAPGLVSIHPHFSQELPFTGLLTIVSEFAKAFLPLPAVPPPRGFA
jgi:hypothetical protein